MAGTTFPSSAACETAVRALLEARWGDWRGLPQDCTFATIERLFGGSNVLESEDALGSERVACTRSSLDEAPLLVWHRGQDVLLLEGDLSDGAARPPAVRDGMHRLDTWWGAASLPGGEWVLPQLGLALIVTADENVVGWLGFGACSVEHYLGRLRPRRAILRPLPPPRSRHPRKGDAR